MIRVGVIRGGAGDEYKISLASGEHILSHLRSDVFASTHKAIDLFVDSNGVLHKNGLPLKAEKLSENVDIVFNALHGAYGESGKVQALLERLGVPYTGSGPFPSALGYNKALAKEQFAKLDIKTPRHILYLGYQEDFDGPKEEYAFAKAQEVFDRLPPPWIVKPLTGSYFMGIHVCKTFPELVQAFKNSTSAGTSILVEEMIEGKEASVNVIEKFRGKNLYTMPPIEVHASGREVCPGNFSNEEKRELERLACLIHEGLNLRHYSQSDFIVTPRKGIYAIEVNTQPRLAEASLIPRHLSSIGSSMPEFLKHIIELAKS